MTHRLLALCGVTLTLILIFASVSPADARRGGHGFSGGRHFGHAPRFHQPRLHVAPRVLPRAHVTGPRVHHRRFHRHRHRHIFLGAPLLYGGYYYYYGDCDWLRRRALHTGSPYWWDRYYNCLYGSGY
jgi:hypothetical protein